MARIHSLHPGQATGEGNVAMSCVLSASSLRGQGSGGIRPRLTRREGPMIIFDDDSPPVLCPKLKRFGLAMSAGITVTDDDRFLRNLQTKMPKNNPDKFPYFGVMCWIRINPGSDK